MNDIFGQCEPYKKKKEKKKKKMKFIINPLSANPTKTALLKSYIVLRYGCSPVNLLHIFRTPFYKNNFGGLLLHLYGMLMIRV